MPNPIPWPQRRAAARPRIGEGREAGARCRGTSRPRRRRRRRPCPRRRRTTTITAPPPPAASSATPSPAPPLVCVVAFALELPYMHFGLWFPSVFRGFGGDLGFEAQVWWRRPSCARSMSSRPGSRCTAGPSLPQAQLEVRTCSNDSLSILPQFVALELETHANLSGIASLPWCC